MKSIYLVFLLLSTIAGSTYSQDTFSIVAADSSTREVGSAGASCVDLIALGIADAGFLGDLLPDTGAINTQAFYLATNQNNARTRMRAGDTPAQIIQWLTANDAGSNPASRQYGIVGFAGANVSSAGYTGVNTQNYKNHITGAVNGIYYSIQGNILLGQHVLDSMEAGFINAQGDLACRMMAALQGANMVGADTRCTSDGTSSLFAFLKVSQPTDAYGSPSFSIGVRTSDNSGIEPIDSLQILFDLQKSCGPAAVNEINFKNSVNVYPNPTSGKIIISIKKDFNQIQNGEIYFYDSIGKNVFKIKLNYEQSEIDFSSLRKGVYFYSIVCEAGVMHGKLVRD